MGFFSSKQGVHDSNRTGAVRGARARQKQAAVRERHVTCRACKGKGDFPNGYLKNGQPATRRCNGCNGSGQVTA